MAICSPQQQQIHNKRVQRIGSGLGSWPERNTFKILLYSC